MLRFRTAILVFPCLFAATPVFGHVKLEKSDPANGAVLTSAPKALSLDFGHKTSLTTLKLKGGDKDITFPSDPASLPASHFSFSLPPLDAGAYTVKWISLSAEDGHVMSGIFSFSVQGQ